MINDEILADSGERHWKPFFRSCLVLSGYYGHSNMPLRFSEYILSEDMGIYE